VLIKTGKKNFSPNWQIKLYRIIVYAARHEILYILPPSLSSDSLRGEAAFLPRTALGYGVRATRLSRAPPVHSKLPARARSKIALSVDSAQKMHSIRLIHPPLCGATGPREVGGCIQPRTTWAEFVHLHVMPLRAPLWTEPSADCGGSYIVTAQFPPSRFPMDGA
jgi:hypothetical protein